MDFNLRECTVFLTISGSRAYGIETPESDWDYRGLCIPPLNNYTRYSNRFEQVVGIKNVKSHYGDLLNDDADVQVMELTKFIHLASQCNPSVIETLFTDPKHHIIKHPIMDRLFDIRDLFLSKTVKDRFCGYAYSQLNRIKLHKRYLDNPPVKKPERKDFGLSEKMILPSDQVGAAEALIKEEVDKFIIKQDDLPEHTKIELDLALNSLIKNVWHIINNDADFPIGVDKKFSTLNDVLYQGAIKSKEFSTNFLQILNAEKRYKAAVKEWNEYNHWLKNRNPIRAKLEKKYGFDLKHAAHLYRLIKMAGEILETGKVNVFRADAAEIKSIRSGVWTYEQIIEFAEQENKKLDSLVKKSKLPNRVDTNKIKNVVHDMILDFNAQ